MKLEDRKLIQIGEVGNEFTRFISSAGLSMATGYNRIVFGARGPYIEFDPSHIIHTNIHIPENQLFRISDPRIYYIEFRSCDVAAVKVYYQMRTVAYADYKIGMFYISPLELQLMGGENVLKLTSENEKSREFFE
jgi:hypothetical protein